MSSSRCHRPWKLYPCFLSPRGRYQNRPLPRKKLPDVVKITSHYPAVHGAPMHIGKPSELGIKDLFKPDFGDPIDILPHEEPVFWACGITSQAVAMQAKISLMITHAPGYMFITDIKDSYYFSY